MIKAFFATLGVLAALFFALMFVFVVGGSLAEKNSPPQAPSSPSLADPMAEKNQRLIDLYQSTYETIVQQPTRPVADFYQPVLEMHYLWLEVRDSAYWTGRPDDRAKMDQVITKLVDQVSRDKKIRDAFSGR